MNNYSIFDRNFLLKKDPVWILTTPRSGSTYFCIALNMTCLFFEDFKENFINNYSNPELLISNKNLLDISKTKNEMIKFISKNGFRNNAKIQLNQFFPLYEERKLIEKEINPKYILLERDIFEKTISCYFVEYSNIWHLSSKKNNDTFFSKKIPFFEKKVLKIYEKYKFLDNIGWENFLLEKNFLRINYSDLIENPVSILENTLNYLELEHKHLDLSKIFLRHPLSPTKRKETTEYVNRLKKIILG